MGEKIHAGDVIFQDAKGDFVDFESLMRRTENKLEQLHTQISDISKESHDTGWIIHDIQKTITHCWETTKELQAFLKDYRQQNGYVMTQILNMLDLKLTNGLEVVTMTEEEIEERDAKVAEILDHPDNVDEEETPIIELPRFEENTEDEE